MHANCVRTLVAQVCLDEGRRLAGGLPRARENRKSRPDAEIDGRKAHLGGASAGAASSAPTRYCYGKARPGVESGSKLPHSRETWRRLIWRSAVAKVERAGPSQRTLGESLWDSPDGPGATKNKTGLPAGSATKPLRCWRVLVLKILAREGFSAMDRTERSRDCGALRLNR
jgi:hypothetical protein